ncbi:hypothetical protein [Bacteroides sp. 41_26]|uniref:hypothetical protein n=1 Tax=Bacteroides sp. 41_26 TaxID=1896973 RepID=UPI00259D23B3|nr:hypothetical protein [Bacteroides sp. 41_26]
MEKERINVRGSIDSLEINEVFTIPKKERRASNVRNTAYTVACDTGKKFSVSAKTDTIVVTRIA